jgi:hypothetical protein
MTLIRFRRRLPQLLAAEEQREPITSLADWTIRSQQREQMVSLLAQLEQQVAHYRRRLAALPALPEWSIIQWAQHILSYPNGRILVVDSLFPADAALLLQILVLDFTGQVHLHHCIANESLHVQAECARFGIDAHDWHQAHALPQIWPALQAVLHGCYLLAWDLRQARLVLEQEAQRFGLEPLILIGEALSTQAIRCYQSSGRTSLASLCAWIGHPLSPCAPIMDRARGQLALLEAMAQGVSGKIMRLSAHGVHPQEREQER